MPELLILSTSSRALAESARLANYSVHSIDAFADVDTQNIAVTASRSRYFFQTQYQSELIHAVQTLLTRFDIEGIVLGSGFEMAQTIERMLEFDCRIYCNRMSTLSDIRDPMRLSSLFAGSEIKFPHTRPQEPVNPKGFLVKSMIGNGGTFVQNATSTTTAMPASYYQRYINGDTYSVLFLTDGEQCEIVGVNRIFQLNLDDLTPYRYGGAIATVLPSVVNANGMHDALRQLCRATGLRGLCGMDFILTPSSDCYVIEINARPPASFELHQSEASLLQAHLDCFLSACKPYPSCASIKAYAVIYANEKIRIPIEYRWPEWVRDRPQSNAVIAMSQPVCTAHAEAMTVEETYQQLSARKVQLKSLLAEMAADVNIK